jgi:hypothetical protein
LFSPADIEALMAEAGQLRSMFQARTMQTFIGLLAVTGLRVGADRLTAYDSYTHRVEGRHGYPSVELPGP